MRYNWVDFTILGIIGISILVSFFRGAVREVFALAIWILGIWAAFTFAIDVEPLIPRDWPFPNSIRLALSGSAILLIVLVIGGLIMQVLGAFLDHSGMSGTDRVLGLVFGALRGVLIVIIVVFFARMTAVKNDDWWKHSMLMPYFESGAEWVEEKWKGTGLSKKVDEFVEVVVNDPTKTQTQKPKEQSNQEEKPENGQGTETIILTPRDATTPATNGQTGNN